MLKTSCLCQKESLLCITVGEKISDVQPLLSENSKFWAQVEPVPKWTQAKGSYEVITHAQKSSPRGPQLMIARHRKVSLAPRHLLLEISKSSINILPCRLPAG